MNRLERMELLTRVSNAEAAAQDVRAQLNQALERISALEAKRGPGRPPKEATDGDGQRAATS